VVPIGENSKRMIKRSSTPTPPTPSEGPRRRRGTSSGTFQR
jgi:Ca-activated chloride channel family protein